jgi:CPA1 family monovalent cation:H+ antiporter
MTTFSTVEFLLWLLLAASVVAVITARLRIPYTVALVLGGLALGSIHLPLIAQLIQNRPDWLTPDVALVVFLPPLLFEGSLKIQLRHLRENLVPILLLATLGVFVAAFITAFAVHWAIGLPIAAALVFGAIVAPTDPISVLAIFRSMAVTKRLEVIVEGESLFNDGTAAVLFGILVGGTAKGGLSVLTGVQEFLLVVLGGIALGLVFGFVISKITERIDDPQIEITLTTIAAYGSYLVGQSLHVSGVIAVVATGLMIGNFGARVGMSPRTRVSLWSFWEYAAFVINSIVFLLIGLQVRIGDLVQAWRPALLAVGAVLLGRVLSVYALAPVSNAISEKIPLRWQHVLVAGGLRGSLSLALALGLPTNFPYRSQILAMTFGVVAFTIVVEGMSIRPLLRWLGISSLKEDEYDRARVRRAAVLSAQAQLDDLLRENRISTPAFELLRRELEQRLDAAQREVEEASHRNEDRLREEIRQARSRLKAAEKSSIEQALHDGLILQKTASAMIEEVDREPHKPGESDGGGSGR